LNAVRVASSPAAPRDGVLVVFNDEIHCPKDVTKTHTSSVSTFQSPFAGPVGYADGAEVVFIRQPLSHRRVRPATARLEVFLLKAAAGASNSLLRCCIDLGADGIVLEGTGLGHVPADWVPAIRDAVRENIPVVLTSRTLGGRVLPLYGDVGGGRELSEAGVINGGSLSGPKARIKLMVGLGAGMKGGELRNFFEEDTA
jgi:L-asparaginase